MSKITRNAIYLVVAVFSAMTLGAAVTTIDWTQYGDSSGNTATIINVNTQPNIGNAGTQEILYDPYLSSVAGTPQYFLGGNQLVQIQDIYDGMGWQYTPEPTPFDIDAAIMDSNLAELSTWTYPAYTDPSVDDMFAQMNDAFSRL